MPLQLRRDHLSLKYYARTKQNPSNPANQLVDDCIEYQIYNHKWNDHTIPYGFRVQNLLKDNDLDKIKLVTKNIPDPPPWIIGQAKTSSNIKNSISKKENPHIIKTKALEYIDNAYKNHLKFTPMAQKTQLRYVLKKRSLRRPTTLQELSGSVTQKWSQAVTGSTKGSSRRLNKTSLRRSTTLQELSGSVTQKWSQAVTGSNNSIFTTKTVRTKEKIVNKTNYTARVIRVSDSEMESGRNRQYRRLFKTSLRRSTTLQELSGKDGSTLLTRNGMLDEEIIGLERSNNVNCIKIHTLEETKIHRLEKFDSKCTKFAAKFKSCLNSRSSFVEMWKCLHSEKKNKEDQIDNSGEKNKATDAKEQTENKNKDQIDNGGEKNKATDAKEQTGTYNSSGNSNCRSL
ncbi:unnamed protein product [Mytilus coruscus]|uniref:Uncharacterized protein n=1 Tax=Mytilus coruscus TaxID=42192 RepID=A0A6J8B358_MYTCO|nr:unnamed protein product [Mytilus coruscus]